VLTKKGEGEREGGPSHMIAHNLSAPLSMLTFSAFSSFASLPSLFFFFLGCSRREGRG